MSTRPYMPLFVGDYLADTAHLTAEESGAYMFLIMNYWQRGTRLPDDSARLAMIARVPADRWAQIEPTLRQFFTIEEGVWKHKRIDKELARSLERSEKAKSAGRASAAAKSERTLNERSTDVGTDVQLSGNYPNPNPTQGDSKTITPESDAARENRVFENSSLGVGLGGEPSIEAKRRVCAELGLSECDPIIENYRNWKRSKGARDPDGMFLSFARRNIGRLPEAVLARIRLQTTIPPETPAKPPSRPSSSLLTSNLVRH